MNPGLPDRLWRHADRPARERAERCCAAMTFEQKVAVALGDFEAVAELGIPPLRYTDGPNGIRGPDNVTAFPASLALAATFDERLAAAHGTAIAEEARATGSNVLLGPAVDIARLPLGGRLPEAMGEDPYLTSRLAAAEVRAIQDRHVISMVKHFIGNNADPGATRELSLRLDRDDLAAFDEASGAWVVHQGRYEILVGRSSRDIRGRAGFEVGARTPFLR